MMLHTSVLKVTAVVGTYPNRRGKREQGTAVAVVGLWLEKKVSRATEKMKYQGLKAKRERGRPILDKQDYWS